MRRCFLFSFTFVILFSSAALAGIYRSEHFIINSDLDPRYVKFIQTNAEAYYKQMEQLYFKTGGRKPITIYYSKTQADTQKLFDKHGIKSKAYYGQYFPNIPAIYTHRLMSDGGGTGWGTLFHEITHHFVGLNYPQSTTWLDEGLACILGEQSRIIKGKLSMGFPNPWRENALRSMIENGFQIDVRRLTSLSAEEFHSDRNNYHPNRAMFYWIYEIGHLSDYLQNVEHNGYSISVLEQTVNLPSNRINAELLAFIKKNCYAGAFLYDSYSSKNDNEKEGVLLKSLELMQDYKAAHLELARLYCKNGDNSKCREHLIKILSDPECIEYPEAAKLMGHSYYMEKNYGEALKYYDVALDYSEYIEYQYEIYYRMAECYHYLKDYATASKMHRLFLDNNWEPERLSKQVLSSKKYLEDYEKSTKVNY